MMSHPSGLDLADACPTCYPGDHPPVLPRTDPVDDGTTLRAEYEHEVCGRTWALLWDAAEWPAPRFAPVTPEEAARNRAVLAEAVRPKRAAA
jgi:hypothetical protein